jgi:Family of unknown function (DUF6519)
MENAMKGDFSRLMFSRKKHYVKVNMQQGGVQLDADWIEQNDIHNYRDRISLREIIGEHGTVVQNDGFRIVIIITQIHISFVS